MLNNKYLTKLYNIYFFVNKLWYRKNSFSLIINDYNY